MASEKQARRDATATPPALLQPLCPPPASPASKRVTQLLPRGPTELPACGCTRGEGTRRDLPREPVIPSAGGCHRARGRHGGLCLGRPLSLRGPGEDAPRRLPRKGRAARGSSARRERVSRRGALPRLLKGKTPHSPPPQESAMLGRPPSPRSPRSRRPRRPPAPCGVGGKGGTAATAQPSPRSPASPSRLAASHTQGCPPC